MHPIPIEYHNILHSFVLMYAHMYMYVCMYIAHVVHIVWRVASECVFG